MISFVLVLSLSFLKILFLNLLFTRLAIASKASMSSKISEMRFKVSCKVAMQPNDKRNVMRSSRSRNRSRSKSEGLERPQGNLPSQDER
jgi:hypothetical protein